MDEVLPLPIWGAISGGSQFPFCCHLLKCMYLHSSCSSGMPPAPWKMGIDCLLPLTTTLWTEWMFQTPSETNKVEPLVYPLPPAVKGPYTGCIYMHGWFSPIDVSISLTNRQMACVHIAIVTSVLPVAGGCVSQWILVNVYVAEYTRVCVLLQMPSLRDFLVARFLLWDPITWKQQERKKGQALWELLLKLHYPGSLTIYFLI